MILYKFREPLERLFKLKMISIDEKTKKELEVKRSNQFLIENLKDYMKENKTKYNYKKVALFGSRANNTYNEDSDIDLLIEFDNSKTTLFSIAKLINSLNEEFKLKVDIVPFPYETNGFKLRIDKEILIYGEDNN